MLYFADFLSDFNMAWDTEEDVARVQAEAVY